MGINLFTIEGLTARLGSRRVLDSVGFTVREGELLGLIGPNGSGKTTLFECLAGLLPVESGIFQYHERLLAATQRHEAIFYMPDGITPWGGQSVEWALTFFERLYRRSSKSLIEPLRLGGLLTSTIAHLSKGERKRALLALALLAPQPILALDEPFDGLDLRQVREVMELLRIEVKSGRTLILSIHQLTDAARVCDRLVLLADGRICGEGTVEELRTRAKLDSGGLEEIFLALT